MARRLKKESQKSAVPRSVGMSQNSPDDFSSTEPEHPCCNSLSTVPDRKLSLFLLQLYGTSFILVGFEVFTVVVMKSIIFWDMTPFSPLSLKRQFLPDFG
jgi:hypothetical protein